MRWPYGKVSILVSISVLGICGLSACEHKISIGNENEQTHMQNGLSRMQKLIRGKWVVEDISKRGVIDFSHMSLTFDDNGLLSGQAGCNTYSTQYTLADDQLAITNIATTRKMCPTALMHQEKNFLHVLQNAETFTFDDTDALIITAQDGTSLLARLATS